MPLFNALANLGGIAGGYQSMQERLQRQQYNQALTALNLQNLQQRIQDQQNIGGLFRTLSGLGGGGNVPLMGQPSGQPGQPRAAPSFGGINWPGFWGGSGFQQPSFLGGGGAGADTGAPATTPGTVDLGSAPPIDPAQIQRDIDAGVYGPGGMYFPRHGAAYPGDPGPAFGGGPGTQPPTSIGPGGFTTAPSRSRGPLEGPPPWSNWGGEGWPDPGTPPPSPDPGSPAGAAYADPYLGLRPDYLPNLPPYGGGAFGAQPPPLSYTPTTSTGAETGTLSGLPDLRAVQNQIYGLESNFGRDLSTSSSGATGPMQMLPSTFRQYAQPGENINNFADNMNVGGRYAADLYQKSGGDRAATLVGYNAGEGAMRRFQESGDNLASVPQLEPAYKKAVLQAQSGNMYGTLNQSASPQDHIDGAYGVRNTFAQMPQLPAALPRLNLGQVAQAITAANPNATDQQKGSIFLKLWPLLSADAKEQSAEAWQRYKAQFGQYKFGITSAISAGRLSAEPLGGPVQQPDGTWVQPMRQGPPRPLGGAPVGATKTADEPLGGPVQKPDGTWVQPMRQGPPRELPGVPARRGGTAPPRFGTIDDLMQKWHDDFVKPKDQGGQGREPTNEEIAQKRADLVQTERPPGQVAQNIGERVMIAGNDVAKALTAVAALPGGTTLGLFGGAQAALGPDLGENVKKAMANSATPQSSQLLQALSNGLGRSLATLAAAGAGQGVQMLAEQMKADMPEANDTGLTIAMKMADIRQITDAALEVLQTDKRLNAGQQAKIGQMLEQVHKAVPFETVDVARLASSGSPDDFAAFYKRLGLGAGGRQPIASGPDVAPPPNVRPPIAGREQPSGAATEGGTATTGTITPGTTKRNPKDGKLYVFKGGDQYDQRNWVEAPEGAVEAE